MSSPGAETGEIVYTIVEMWGDWIDAPHRGEAEFGTPEAAEDWRYIIGRLRDAIGDCSWSLESDTVDPDRLQKYGMTELQVTPGVTVKAWSTP